MEELKTFHNLKLSPQSLWDKSLVGALLDFEQEKELTILQEKPTVQLLSRRISKL